MNANLEAKSKEVSEFVELITNLNSIVVHLKATNANIRFENESQQSQVNQLSSDLNKLQSNFDEKTESEQKAQRAIEDLTGKYNVLLRENDDNKGVIFYITQDI